MLCQYSVKNYKSIKEEITLNMEALDISEHNDSLIVYDDGEKYLPLSVIYGPNGGGKSNLLNSLFYLISKITTPVLEIFKENDISLLSGFNKGVTTPYKFDESFASSPSEFDLYFRDSKYEYHYSASILKGDFKEEYLSKKGINSSKYINVFSRDENEIRLYNSLSKYNSKDIFKSISKDISLISYLRIMHNENAIVKNVFSWFKFGIINIDGTKNYDTWFYEQTLMEVSKINGNQKKIINHMKEMDINIEDYIVYKENDSEHVKVKHIVNGLETYLNFEEESMGTKKIAGLLSYVTICLELGSTLVIDELDCNIHPKLLGYIINLFSNKNINKRGCQLIFTSHDLITMSSEYLRRDEIWFIAKNSEESSYLYSLAEFKKDNGKIARKDESYSKQYLEGRYGSDPYLQKIISW